MGSKFPQRVSMTVRGRKDKVTLEGRRADGSYSARLRMPGDGSSVRGVVRERIVNGTNQFTFTPSNPDLFSEYLELRNWSRSN